MTFEEFEIFSARLVELGEVFDVKLTESKLLLYFQALQDLPLDAVQHAIIDALRTQKFFPRPAELRACAVGDNEDVAEHAWMEYKKLARRVGGYMSPEMDATLADTLTAVFGGWQQACWTELSPEMWTAKRKEFGRVYRVLTHRGVGHDPKRLVGFCEEQNGIAPTDQKTLSVGTDE